MAEPTREEIDAKIAASEARADTKFTEVLRHIDGQTATLEKSIAGLDARLDGRAGTFEKEIAVLGTRMEAVERSTSGIKTTVIGTGVALAALIVGVLAFGDQLFGLGLSASDIAERAAQKVSSEQSASNEQLAQQAAEAAIATYRREERVKSKQ